MDLFIWFPILILLACGISGLIFSLMDASDRIERITNIDELRVIEESNVYEFPTRTTNNDGDDIA
jgi:hypothetical protein